MNILVFAASLRKDSFNRKLAIQAARHLGAQAGIMVDLADFREFEMPMYDGDLETVSGIPAGGVELIRRVTAASAVVISTPEYNGGIPGVLKNAIDWSSRGDQAPWAQKPVLLIGASPGALGAVRSLWHTRHPFEALGAYVFPEMFGLPKAHQAFTEAGDFVDPKNLERLKSLLERYLKFAGALTSEARSL